MGQITRCPLNGEPCAKQIKVEEKTFFLAEAEKPEKVRTRRNKALNEAIVSKYKIRSALEEKGINAFTCKICEMIQTCAYGIADISQNNANVFIELGIMLALGKPTVILVKAEQEKELNLPSDVKGIEVIPFDEYIDIIGPFRECFKKLPENIYTSTPIENLEKINPQIVGELEKIRDEIVKEFNETVKNAGLDTSLSKEEKGVLSPEINVRLSNLEKKLEEFKSLGLVADAKTSFNRGNYFHQQGKYQEALTSYNWSIENEPNNPYSRNNRGNAYHKLNRYQEALADYDRAIELKPNFAFAFNNRGVTFSKLGNYQKALADYDKAIELKPDYAEAYNNRGTAYSELEKHREALADYNKAIEIKPDYSLAYNNRGTAYSELEKHREALADYSKAIELKPNYAEAFNNRGLTYAKLGKYKEALDDYNKAIERKLDYTEAFNNRGVSYLKIKQFKKALSDFEKAIEITPEFPNAFYNKACIFSLQRKIDDAFKYLEKAISIDKESKEIAKTDEDFKNIRNDPRFEKLVGE